ncbi:MAG: hypothetical protein K2N52_00620, partial [Clostridia bacterium]|nr:hypothetical protein [Clostridia bacterium]
PGVAVTIYFPIELVACAILVPVYAKVLRKINRSLINKPVKVAESNEPVNGAVLSENVDDNMS